MGVYGDCFGLSRDILGLFYIEKQGMAMRLEAVVEQQPPFGEISSSFCRVARQEGTFGDNSGSPLLHAFFSRCVMIGCIHPRSNRDTIEVIIARSNQAYSSRATFY
jgi:hypothetical protein